ncbi:hypothetical protein HMPREF1982_00475 [Clostridiales bacterium oral taxon 876 str. F0540]|nr:hypothetical protein HMPREF1982_00475 [Clostridiales bacterium oral taxon 876 str. F0540]
MKENTMLDQVYIKLEKLNWELFQIWTSKIVFSWRWWLEISLGILPWIIWFKVHDKNKTGRQMIVVLEVILITSFLDIVGLLLGLWHYDWNVFPFIPVFIPWNWTLFPVFIILLIQFKSEIKAFYKAVIFSFFCTYIFEPAFEILGMYHRLKWNHWYSFIIYIFIYLFSNYIYNSKRIGDLDKSKG